MAVIAFWFLFSVAVGIWAKNRGRDGVGWFLLSVILSPLIAAIFLAVTKNLAQPSAGSQISPTTHAKCPDCAEPVLVDARVCKHCGCNMAAKGGPVAYQVKVPFKQTKGYRNGFIAVVAIVIAMIAFNAMMKSNSPSGNTDQAPSAPASF